MSRDKVAKTMREYREGKLKSGSGKKVTDRKQALAVAMNQARGKKQGSTPFSAAKSLASKKT